MSYTALYRKYRPAEFDDVKGQDHIVTTLKNQIKANRIGHAYLFCGTRGTGKTTVAKIFAKAVNCENPVDGSPCGECPSCRSIASGTSMNVVEFDAASNNGVESIRQIRDEVEYSPTEGRYRVYIIDEVHMLSTGAFNALLKTLEEPPSYVIFVLATTEAHKIPVTILSRCQRYDFHRITIDTISARLTDLMRQEGEDVEERAIRYIAKAADGSMRDALSLLDQCLAFYMGQTLTYDRALEVLGAVDTEIFSRLLRCILADDVAGAVGVLEELVMQGRELGQFVTDFIWYLRNLLLIRGSDEMEEVLDMSVENLALLKEEAAMLEDEELMRYIRIFSDLSGEIRYAVQKRVLIEIALIRLCRPQMEDRQDELQSRVSRLERRIEQGIPVQQASSGTQASAEPAAAVPQSAPARERPIEIALSEDIKQIVRKYHSIIRELPGVTRSYMQKAVPILDRDQKLVLVFKDNLAYDYVAEESRHREVEALFSEHVGKQVTLSMRLDDPNQSVDPDEMDLTRMIHMEIEVEDD